MEREAADRSMTNGRSRANGVHDGASSAVFAATSSARLQELEHLSIGELSEIFRAGRPPTSLEPLDGAHSGRLLAVAASPGARATAGLTRPGLKKQQSSIRSK